MSEAEAAPPEKPASSGPNAIIVAAVVCVLMLGGAYALASYVLPARIAEEIAKRSATEEGSGDAPAAAPEGAKKAEGGKEGGKEGKVEGEAKDFVLTDLLVNVSGTSGTRFVKTTVFFDAEPAVLQDLEKKRAKITDIVQQTIASKKMDELTAPDSRGKLRSELLATINPLLDAKGEVRNIYFQEFIIQ